jgi:hypothetical protein
MTRVGRGAAYKRADAAGIADPSVTPAPQPVNLDRKSPQSRIGCGILNGEAFFRGDRERDRLLAELQLMVARLRDRAQGASSVAARPERYILRPAILEDEARTGRSARREDDRFVDLGGDQRRQRVFADGRSEPIAACGELGRRVAWQLERAEHAPQHIWRNPPRLSRGIRPVDLDASATR